MSRGPAGERVASRAVAADHGVATTEGTSDRARWDQPWVGRAALGLALVPFLVAAVQLTIAVGGSYHPVGDHALTEMLTRDVGRHAVLIGPISRDGWHHPGPLSFWIYAVPYRLLGSTSTAMGVAALLVNGLSVAAMVLLARRRGGTPLALLTLVVCAVLVRALGPEALRQPWNPFVTVLPYGVLVFLTWSLACRDRWALPAAVFVASFLAQTHVGYAALALPLLVLGVGWCVIATVATTSVDVDEAPTPLRARARPLRAPTLRAPTLAAALVAVLAWAAPVYEELTRDPGNLSRVVDWFRTGGPTAQSPRGLGAGLRIATAPYGLPPEWVVGARPVTATAEPPYLQRLLLPVLLLVVVAAAGWLVRRRVEGAWALVVVWGAGLGAGIVATARIVGPVYSYRNGWAWVLGAVGGLLVLWALWEVARRRAPDRARRALGPAVLVALAGLAVASSVALVRAGEPDRELSSRAGAVADELVDALPAGRGVVLVDGRTSFVGLVQAPAIALQLEREGIDVALPTTGAGDHRAVGDRPVRARVVVAAGDAIVAAVAEPALRLVAYDGDLSLAEIEARARTGRPIRAESALAVLIETG